MGVLDDLPLNEKITIDMPQDLIPVEGINEVNRYLTDQLIRDYPHLRDYPDYDRFLNRDFDREWILTKGGTFPKRVARFLYNERKVKLTAAQQSEIGNIARRHCAKNRHFVIDITKDFDWQAGDFGDSGSCYFSSHKGARRLLAHYNARAIRFYEPDNPAKGIARAWLAPLSEAYFYDKALITIPEAVLGDLRKSGFVVFNGYGLETQRCTRILATYLGLSYTMIGLSNYNATGGLLWINHYSGNAARISSAAFLVGAADKIETVKSIDLRLNKDEIDRMNCAGTCGHRYQSREMVEVGLRYYCRPCFDQVYTTCSRCRDVSLKSEASQVIVGTLRGVVSESWCQRCIQNEAKVCVSCRRPHAANLTFEAEEGTDPWCRECFVEHHHRCTKCKVWKSKNQVGKEGACTRCKK